MPARFRLNSSSKDSLSESGEASSPFAEGTALLGKSDPEFELLSPRITSTDESESFSDIYELFVDKLINNLCQK